MIAIRLAGILILIVAASGASAQVPEVSHVHPDGGLNEEVVPVQVYGGSLDSLVSTVVLVKSGYPAVSATSVNVVSPNYLTCQFDLTGVLPGLYNLVVSRVSASDTLPACFLV